MPRLSLALLPLMILLAAAPASSAESPDPAWLRYSPIDEPTASALYGRLPAVVVTLGDSPVLASAQSEIVRGVRGMLGRTLRTASQIPAEPAIVLARLPALRALLSPLTPPEAFNDDASWLITITRNAQPLLIVTAPNDRGVLYGAFALLRKLSLHQPIDSLDDHESPSAPIRWVNQWDNLDGSIERGYAGRSLFFDSNHVATDLSRAADYARLLASLGINGCTVNNVNANPRMLAPDFLPELARIAAAFRPWGVRMSISVDFTSPKTIGGLDSFDPLDPRVARWWQQKVDDVYSIIPDLAGFVLKADSEGRLGPSVYGRTHADAANVLARALRPHGGVLAYRGFVYNHHMDWRNLKNDRARAAYDNFHPLDGKFDPNVLVQIKHGPIDFQAREPVSPLIAALPNTNETLELQITQEYTGQQRHLCYLVPMWKQVLDFDLHANGAATPVKSIVSGAAFHRPLGGFAGVANVGLDLNWLGSDLALANLYGFGRLAWNPDLSTAQITDEWTHQTFGDDARVVEIVNRLQLASWRAYEGYTGPLGLGTLTDILHSHYGPGIETAERNGWGQWIRADRDGIGMDRTVATGTGYIGQYPAAVATLYESLRTCPDALLLFMHHVPYSYVLHSGKTVIQHVYDSHYDAAAEAQQFPIWWQTLRGRIDPDRFSRILAMLEYQAGHAVVWRDAICSWFLRESNIPDAQGRAGHFPNRIEAESMQLIGYTTEDVTPWETASGSKAVACRTNTTCIAQFDFTGAPGPYSLDIEYFDLPSGTARFAIFLNDQRIDNWTATAHLPTTALNGDSSIRRRIANIALRPHDRIRIEGAPDAGDPAALDYIEVSRPASH